MKMSSFFGTDYLVDKKGEGRVCRASAERIHNFQAIDVLPVLKVFRVENGISGLLGSPHDQGVPDRELVQTMQINCSENIGQIDEHQVEVGEEFEFPRRRSKVFLQDLRREDAGFVHTYAGKKVESCGLLRWSVVVIRVEQRVGIEKTTHAGGALRD
jgi:hypothetical protein